MRPVYSVLLLRVLALVGLTASTMLLVDYLSLESSFCGAASGCGAVKDSGLGYVRFGDADLPFLPILGVVGFASLVLGSLLPSAPQRRAVCAPLAYAMAAGAFVLLGLQAFLIGRFCWLCVVVDLISLALGGLAFSMRWLGWETSLHAEQSRASLVDASELLAAAGGRPTAWQEDSQSYVAPNPLVRPEPTQPLRLHTLGWFALALFAVLAPVLYPRVVHTSDLSPPVRALAAKSGVTVVEFFDFECPHCRALAPTIHELAAEPGVTVVRQYVPLPGHELALEGSKLSVCAAEQGKEAQVAELLLTGEMLTAEQLTVARKLPGLDEARLGACLASERPERALREMRERIVSSEFVGLPTTYVGSERILGAEAPEVFFDALERARSGENLGGLTPLSYVALVLGAVALVVFWARIRPVRITSASALDSH